MRLLKLIDDFLFGHFAPNDRRRERLIFLFGAIFLTLTIIMIIYAIVTGEKMIGSSGEFSLPWEF